MGNYWGQISTDQRNELSCKPVEDLSWRNDLEHEKNVMGLFSYFSQVVKELSGGGVSHPLSAYCWLAGAKTWLLA
ncbi:conserved hypothetical protein [Ricinus communis]|uniref:Uncharacterized protein n=1 Tax=Ricinus communis TaxID=3988 RepID=B9SIB3_RICCO|nr:conserved hypothetical protein [Ricinus communis]